MRGGELRDLSQWVQLCAHGAQKTLEIYCNSVFDLWLIQIKIFLLAETWRGVQPDSGYKRVVARGRDLHQRALALQKTGEEVFALYHGTIWKYKSYVAETGRNTVFVSGKNGKNVTFTCRSTLNSLFMYCEWSLFHRFLIEKRNINYIFEGLGN